MDAERALGILDAAYAQGVDDDAWMRSLVEAIAPAFDRGLGMTGYFVRLGGPGEFEGHGHVPSTSLDIARVWQILLDQAGREFMRQAHLLGPFATTDTESFARLEGAGLGIRTIDGFRAGGAAGLMAINPDGHGIAFGTYSPKDGFPEHGAHWPWNTELERDFWERVVPHLITAYRLRRLLRAQAPQPEAILQPDGRLVHAEPAAQKKSSQDELRQAVVRIDRAHSERDSRALDLWRCMIQKRWTLVDRFEHDGRRYVVAYPNEAQVDLADPRLSERERVVTAAAALGHSNKLIAEELDLAESTVATHLSRAARKLGVRNRTELVHAVRNRKPV